MRWDTCFSGKLEGPSLSIFKYVILVSFCNGWSSPPWYYLSILLYSWPSPRYYLYFYRSHIVSLSGCHSRLTYLPLCSTHPESQTKTYHTTNFLLHKVGESECLEIIGLTFNCFIFINSPLIPKA